MNFLCDCIVERFTACLFWSTFVSHCPAVSVSLPRLNSSAQVFPTTRNCWLSYVHICHDLNIALYTDCNATVLDSLTGQLNDKSGESYSVIFVWHSFNIKITAANGCAGIKRQRGKTRCIQLTCLNLALASFSFILP